VWVQEGKDYVHKGVAQLRPYEVGVSIHYTFGYSFDHSSLSLKPVKLLISSFLSNINTRLLHFSSQLIGGLVF
jgi:hypothetical protein